MLHVAHPLVPVVALTVCLAAGVEVSFALMVAVVAAGGSAAALLTAPPLLRFGDDYSSALQAVRGSPLLGKVLRRRGGALTPAQLALLGVRVTDLLPKDPELRQIIQALAPDCDQTVDELRRTCAALLHEDGTG